MAMGYDLLFMGYSVGLFMDYQLEYEVSLFFDGIFYLI